MSPISAAATSAAELLEQARVAYRGGVADYRDAMLEAGRLLHRFVLARLREGDGMWEGQRLRAGVTRDKAVEEAAESLETEPKRVGYLIATAMAVDLLAGPEGVGVLGHATLYRFRCFVCRCRGKRRGNGPGRRKDSPISETEEWQIKPGFEVKAKALLARAVRENFTQLQALAEVAKVFRPSGRPTPRLAPRRTTVRTEPAPSPMPPKAAPGDVAVACMELVERAEDPREAANLLQAKLAVFLSRKKGWWAG